MERYICIHGHFYQPPRENPWLEAIEMQDSAYPYHDWNARITAECYQPNTAARILDDEDRIVRIVNNYTKISFNFGPTLLTWLQDKAPECYAAIIEADQQSQGLFSGHGSALAQAYNHMILPLANQQDKYTQVLWGMRYFEHHFGRQPEGMWLPETAVDLGTLTILADLGIRFTILAPHQAQRMRRLGGRSWRDVSGGRIDPSMPYLQQLPGGRTITLFFYDGPISRAVAFEGLLNQGEQFAKRLLSAFSDKRPWPQLVHIATDGETYGHHHRYGEMALAYAIHYIESNHLARFTNYGEYLEKHPPTHQVEIYENTSWSCAHGVERWRSNCDCLCGERPEWQQTWRTPLREAFDWLRDAIAPAYEKQLQRFVQEPWAARNDYISVILDRSSQNITSFLNRHATRPLDEADKITVLKLLEMQRHAMLMYTSCGWFFSELSGLETVQVMQYAGRVVQLAEELFNASTEAGFLALLQYAISNLPGHCDGRHIYEKFVQPAMVDWGKIGAHYAASSLFEAYPERARVYCYIVHREDYNSYEAGRAKLVVGRATLTSAITRESVRLCFGMVHFGDHNLSGGVCAFRGVESYQTLVQELAAAFASADFAAVIRLIDRHFGASTYSLRTLFRDEQRKTVQRILESVLTETEAIYRQIYEHHAPLMRFLTELRMPLPPAFQAAATFVLHSDLRRAFTAAELDPERINTLVENARMAGITLQAAKLEYALRQSLERLAEQLAKYPDDQTLLQRLKTAADLVRALPFEVELSKLQNICYELLQQMYPRFQAKAAQGNVEAQAWLSHFQSLGETLSLRIA